ncbi:MAG TPA: flagellar biosynthetic protein FliO [Nevskia sp.]|nr:flagellar biosynthetic protein FliO [Nevskia sp.]
MGATAANAVPVGAGMAHTALSLLLVLGLIFALAWLLRRVQSVRAPAAGVLSIRGGLQVGAKERVLWIRAGDKDLLIGVAAGSVQTLHVFDQPPAGPAEGAAPPSFKEALRRIAAGGRAQ